MVAAVNPDGVTGWPRRVAALLALMGALGAHAAGANGELAARILAARSETGVEPERGLVALRDLRATSIAQGLLDARLAVDAAECRVLSDLDNVKALAVADAGLAAAGTAPTPPVRDPWLRLRICRAGVLVEIGEVAAGRAEIEALIALATGAADAGVLALVRLERGVLRSRHGDLLGGQRDLLEACEVLKVQGPPRDHELCLGHLASHFRRVGDLDEAHRLQLALRDAARRSGATYDDAIYTFSLAQVQQAQERWTEAFDSYSEAAAASERLGDRPGVGYAEHALGVLLLQLKRPQEALPHLDRSLAYLEEGVDPRQFEQSTVTRSEILAALDRMGEALAALDATQTAVRKRGELPLLAQWLKVRSQVMRAAGRWQEAWQALSEARDIEQGLHKQRQSEQAARLRMQFNRQRDADDLTALRQLNEQGQRLRQTQAVALGLFVILLLLALVFASRKFRQARRLQRLASTDELTGLPNRRALLARADDSLARARQAGTPLSVLMIDVDHFKSINDVHGHAVGDEVLRHLARVLAAGLRGHDRLGRLGGEEFLAVLPAASVADARQVAERMRTAVEAEPVQGPQGPVHVTVSIGVAGSRGAESAEALIARADAALYRAKHAGRNAVATDPPDGAAVAGHPA